jgi:hypothetical protein
MMIFLTIGIIIAFTLFIIILMHEPTKPEEPGLTQEAQADQTSNRPEVAQPELALQASRDLPSAPAVRQDRNEAAFYERLGQQEKVEAEQPDRSPFVIDLSSQDARASNQRDQ